MSFQAYFAKKPDTMPNSQVDGIIIIAEEFIKMYYDKFDGERAAISQLYTPNAFLTWNGKPIKGVQAIMELFMNLPASEHVVATVKAKPTTYIILNGWSGLTIDVTGTVKYQEEAPKTFKRIFLLAAEPGSDNQWKLIADHCRMNEHV